MLAKLNEVIKNPKIKQYTIFGICQLIIVILALYCYDSFFKQKIGVVNITGITDEFIKTQSRNNITPEELKKRVHAFALSLEKGLHTIGTKNQVVLMPAEAVITGANDYTKDVVHYLSKTLPNIPSNEASQPKIPEVKLNDVDLKDRHENSVSGDNKLEAGMPKST